MKRTRIILSMLLICIMFMSFVVMADIEDKKNENTVLIFALDDNKYSVNGELLTMDVSPTVFEGRTLLPIRYAAEPLGADVGWHQGDKRVTISLEETVIDLWIGEGNALINGKTVPIDPDNSNVKPLAISGRTMLP
ncbi:MAG: copper amine oxidase N-terminal domain-containing protein, partial [Firmicutes bacterium]|nr:copper amine oxidase N-terminal domain-containing protein [Bacillota bacterium]